MEYQLRISMLGGFSISCTIDGQEKRITEQHSTSRRLLLFLQYMAVYHHREVTQEELIKVLWWDEESANPVNAMKTLLHRARALLEELGFPDGKPVIQYKRGVYHWSDEIAIELDTETFERLSAGEFDDAMQAMELYQGDFLASAAECPWVVSMRMYYHARYIKLCAETAAACNKQGRHSEAIGICKKAVEIDPYEETCHLELMIAMAAIGLTQPALQHYHYVEKLFAEQLGIKPSQDMEDIYRRLNQSNIKMEMDLSVIQSFLVEPRHKGAYYCEYGVFQEMYRLEARRAVRSGQEIQLMLLTMLDRGGECLQAKRTPQAMEEMKRVLLSSLRSGDIFARFSPAQYLVMLPGASTENAELVFRRIEERYGCTLIGMSSVLVHSIRPVERSEDDKI